MSNSWSVDRLNSYIIGMLLDGASVPPATHPLNARREWQIWTELVFISICHQANWDRLHDRVIEVAAHDPLQLHPARLAKLKAKQCEELFAPALDADRMRLAERPHILRCLGERTQDWFDKNAPLWLKTQCVSLSGKDSVYTQLHCIPTFAEDPLQKKARVLIHQLLRYGLIEVSDPQNIAPAVDYHIIRLYVRTARVRPTTETQTEQLKSDGTARVNFVTALRRAVEEAMRYSAAGARLRIDELNHLEWQIARSFCVRQDARCHSAPLPDKPVDAVVTDLSCRAGGHCPFATDCPATRDVESRKLVDPQSVKAFY